MFIVGLCKVAAKFKVPRTLADYVKVLVKREARVKKALKATQSKMTGYVGKGDMRRYKDLVAQAKAPLSERIVRAARDSGVPPEMPIGRALGSLRRSIPKPASAGKPASKTKKPFIGALGPEIRGQAIAYSGKTRDVEKKLQLDLKELSKSRSRVGSAWDAVSSELIRPGRSTKGAPPKGERKRENALSSVLSAFAEPKAPKRSKKKP